MIQGEAYLARLNISLTPFSDSPTHFDNSSGPFTLIKLASDSVATALANIVFPVPDGPCNKTPFGIVCPNLDRKSTRLNSSHLVISYAVFCLKKKRYTN